MPTETPKIPFILVLILAILGVCPGATYAQTCTPPPSGLVSWWPGEGTTNDTVGGNNGVLQGNMTYATGEVGQAFSSDGNGSAVSVGNPTNLQLQDFTIEAWIQRGDSTSASASGSGAGTVFGYGYAGYLLGILDDGTPFLTQVGISNVKGSQKINDTTFHHLAVTKNGTTVVFYVDGTATPPTNYVVSFQFSTSAAIGARGDNFTASFLGLIDEVSVYSRALGQSEIQAIFNAGSAGKCSGPTPPLITTQPADQAVVVGNTATFGVAATGSTPLSYQWQFKGALLTGSTNFILMLPNVQPTNGGGYNVIITNAYGSVTSTVATLFVGTAPSILRQPQNQASPVGGTAVFFVDASGSTPLRFQWQLGSNNLAGATNYSLEITNVQATNAGSYDVVATNAFGSITSAPAALTLLLPPSIVTQPLSQTNYVGGNAYFSVVASGSSNLFYQWRFPGTNNIPGATNSTLQLNNIQFSNGGNYSVVVTNRYGAAPPSSNALLTVLAPVCAASPSGLVGWWQGEGSPRDAVSGNSGTLIGNATYATGKVGQAFSFDGNADAVLIGNPTNLQLQDFTIEAWVKRGDPVRASAQGFNSGAIFGYGNAGYILGIHDDGTPFLSQVEISFVEGGQKISDTAFHHLAVTKSGTNVVFYVDGAATLTTNYVVTFQFSTPAAIGARGDNFTASFLGLIDEVSVYNRALAASEVQSVYAATTLGKCATPLSILSQPTNQSLTVGSNTTFSILVSGSGPIGFQWFQNGAPINGATNATLTLTGATFFQAGTYSVTITSALGGTNASNFVFTVKPPPLLVNGGFEKGNFTGWLTNDLSFPFFPLTVRSAGFDSGFGFFLTAPTEGNFCATHGFEGNGPGTISLAQDVFLPSGPAVLTFDYRAAWDMSNYSGSTLPRTFAVTLQPFGGGTPLHTFTLLTAAPGTANPDTGPLSGSLDISAYSGRSLRVSFDATVPEFFTGPGFFQLDNVVLSYSVLPPLVITQSGLNIVLMWPASTTNYTLQASGDLTMSNAWSAINTNLIVHGATNTSATLPITPNPTFYRLIYP